MEKFSEIVLLFCLYAFIGWLWETIYCSIKAKKFVYRGFLVGPYCPVYGFGILAVLYFVTPYQNNLGQLYLWATTVVTVIEYVTSLLLEKLFHATWWDYHGVPLNIHGRVALPVSLFWGAACVLIINVIQPEMTQLVLFLTQRFGLVLPVLLLGVLLTDTVYSVTSLLASRQIIRKWYDAMEKSKAEYREYRQKLEQGVEQKLQQRRDSLQEWSELFREKVPSLPTPRFTFRHLLKNFNKLTLTEFEHEEELRELLKKEILKRKNRNKP